MELFKKDAKRLPKLLLGLFVLSVGIYFTKLSLLGMSSWSVFHEGIAINVNFLTFGLVTSLLGLIILGLSVLFLKTKIGLGTLLNILFVGPLIDLFELLYPKMPDVLLWQSIVLVFGILLTTLGRSLYIASRLGPGPRDGLFVGLSRITKINVEYVKISIELIVLGTGILLGGTFGWGTIIITVVSSYLVRFFFKIFDFDPKSQKQSNVLEYFTNEL